MKASGILKQAKALIDTPEKWCKGAMARDARDIPTGLFGSACKFCMVGAVRRTCIDTKNNTYRIKTCLKYLAISVYCDGRILLADFNDKKTHDEVMSVFDQAITLAEGDGD